MSNALDSWNRLGWHSRRLYASMRAARAEMNELKERCERDSDLPLDIDALDAELARLERRSWSILLKVAALLWPFVDFNETRGRGAH